VHDLLAQYGVTSDRVTFAEMAPLAEYYRYYHHIDVALDPFPYGGGTTTCDALWMGVPVVTLAGQTAVGRGGLSILSNLGLTEWVAQDRKQCIQIAQSLAGNLARLGELRATLRDRMRASPLMDAARFARHVEAAYRIRWERCLATST
jgi:predicted O-linked N-acetylglucosamine transferase (SPINDLY family)